MAQVKLNLNRLSIPQKISLGLEVDAAMTGNARFTTPDPSLATLAAVTAALQQAVTDKAAADSAAQQAAINLRTAEQTFDATITSEAAYVQNKTGGDESGILSAGMGVKADSHTRGLLPAPTGVSASSGDMPLEVDLHWNVVHGRSSYVLRQTVDPITPASVWTTLPSTTKSKTSVTGLVAGRGTGGRSRRSARRGRGLGARPRRRWRWDRAGNSE